MYTYIYMYKYIYIYIYEGMYICIYIYIYIHTYMYVYLYTYVHPSIHPSIHTYIYTHIYTGINDSKDLPLEYLESLYEDIKNNQIKMDFDLNDSAEGFILDFTDSNLWNKMLRKSTADQAPVYI
jgi:hypothetical protein